MTHPAPRCRALLRHLAALLLCLTVLAAGLAQAQQLTPEEATRVGGDMAVAGQALGDVNQNLSPFKESTAKIMAAAPQVPGEVLAALARVQASRGGSEMVSTTALGAVSALVLLGLGLIFRRASMSWRRKFLASEIQARGALGVLALDTAQWAILALGAFACLKLFFGTQDHQDLLVVALLSGLARWTLFVLGLGFILRPGHAPFRLIAMPDHTARHILRVVSLVTFVGLMGISVMPVLLRAGLPIPAGQVIVLLQGAVVAAGCALALLHYRAAFPQPGRTQRMWLWIGGVSVFLVWLSWNLAVVYLKFSLYHSLVYSLRIALIAYVVHALLALSAHAHWWVRLVQHTTNAAAVLALSIMLADLWLVQRFAIISRASWEPILQSLVTTAITLFTGFVAWRYLDLWTEQRLRAASPGLAPGIDDDVAAEPASRLTTLLPLVRVLVGVAILMFVAFLGLSQLGVDVTTLLAGAGVFGLALSFGSQALVRDIVAGIFFMSDDAFRVGEYIDTGRLKGTVERVTLRSVRLRHQNGQIHTIPFGQLNAITNFSRDWQTVKFNLRLARSTELEQTRKCVKRVGQEMLQDPELGKEFLLPLKLQGMVEVTDSALVVRLKFTVRPSNPSVVHREALKRLHRAFANDGIEFAAGVITVQPAGLAVLSAGAAAAAASQAQGQATDNPA